jgi:hypothetical protein
MRKRRVKGDKRKSQSIHARKRFIQRYAIDFTKSMEQEVIAEIRCGRAPLFDKQSLRVSIYDVYYKGSVMRVVYDKKRNVIVTVLPVTH